MPRTVSIALSVTVLPFVNFFAFSLPSFAQPASISAEDVLSGGVRQASRAQAGYRRMSSSLSVFIEAVERQLHAIATASSSAASTSSAGTQALMDKFLPPATVASLRTTVSSAEQKALAEGDVLSAVAAQPTLLGAAR